jgi:radical SAM superfamily enzyme YgiQ (UPF0313 family)
MDRYAPRAPPLDLDRPAGRSCRPQSARDERHAMKVLMLYPRFFEPTFWNPACSGRLVYQRNVTMPPLGLLTIASHLPGDFEVRVIDRNVELETPDDWAWADVVFLSVMATQKVDYQHCVATARAHGKPIAVGGPYTHNSPERVTADADWVCFGEAEDIMEALVADLRADRRPRQYQGGSNTNMARVPIPRFDLLRDINAYADMPIQFSRGCPFKCEFCDIIEIYGRVPRTKPAERVLAELDELLRLGFRGSVFLVDDNFIGNKHKARAMLEELAAWNEAHGSPFPFGTEASLNLADEEPLLDAMAKAKLGYVFIGFETPDPKLLALTQKRQNLLGDPLEKVRRIRERGLHVVGGFILGFDGEDASVFETQRAFIDASGVAVAIIGLLGAVPRTQLWRRLAAEGRLLPDLEQFTINSFDGLNFIPRGGMTKREYLERYGRFVQEMYQPDTAFARSLRGLLATRRPRHRRPWSFHRTYVPAFVRLVYHLGIKTRGFRRPFWRTLLTVAVKNPNAIDGFFFDALFLYHLHAFSQHIGEVLSRYLAAPSPVDVLDEMAAPAPPQHAVASS